MSFKRIGIVGAGTMGIGIAADIVLHGLEVVLIDNSKDALAHAEQEIDSHLRFGCLMSTDIPKTDMAKAKEKIRFTLAMEELRDCEFIIENVTEDIGIKEQVYRQLDTICPPETCFAVDTSCVSITQIGSFTNRPDKIVGIHFMNPSYLKKTVEMIQGFLTSQETIETADKLLKQLNKTSVLVNDYPGFVSNRISHLFMNEAAFVVQDQVADPAKVDKIFRECFGHKMGPLETADLIGLDTVANSLDILYKSYQDSKYRCCPLLRKMVDAGLLGKKSGKGFYSYFNAGS